VEVVVPEPYVNECLPSSSFFVAARVLSEAGVVGKRRDATSCGRFGHCGKSDWRVRDRNTYSR